MNSFDILGVKISAINIDDAVGFIVAAINRKAKEYISVCPVSTIMECRKNKAVLTSVNSAALVTPDGMPVVWLGRMKGHSNVRRVYGPDLLLEICRIAEEKGYANYFYGSSEHVLENLRKNLKSTFPDLSISGVYSPPFRELTGKEDDEIIEIINKSNSDIIWVGLGSPKQDLWMHEHRDKINATVMIGVGAAFDFISGAKKQAPRWMQRAGLEWLFRLMTEPRRLWKRYILGNLLFLCLISKDFFWRKGAANER